MKPGYGLGILVVVLLTLAVPLLGLLSIQGAISMGLLLVGLWTIIAAFLIVEGRDRSYYVGWGVIVAGLSLSYFIPIQDALALILIAIAGLIIATAFYGRAPRGGAPAPQGTAGGSAAAS